MKENQCLLTDQQAAQRLAVRAATLRKWRWAGVGPSFYKIGGAVRYDPQEIDRYLSTCVRRSTSDSGPGE